MADYTIELRTICEDLAEMSGSAYNEVIPVAAPLLFNFDYPIFDEEYRPVLEQKIIKHFYTREIAHETVGMFMLRLDVKMNEIMPYYNELYKSAKFEFDPLTDIHYTSANKGTISTDGQSSGNSGSTTNQDYSTQSSGEEKNVFHNTPQGFVDASDLENGGYATNVRKQNGSSNGSGNSINTNNTNYINTGRNVTTNDYVIEVSGKSGRNSYGKLIQEFRDSLINIDKMVLDELKPLFFMLY